MGENLFLLVAFTSFLKFSRHVLESLVLLKPYDVVWGLGIAHATTAGQLKK